MEGRRTITLEFDGPMAEAEVTLKAASIAVMMQLRDLTAMDAVPLLAEHLLKWNLTTDGRPIPFEPEAIREGVEPGILYKIIGKWYEVATGVAAPLDQPSNDGPSSPEPDSEELFIPMDVL